MQYYLLVCLGYVLRCLVIVVILLSKGILSFQFVMCLFVSFAFVYIPGILSIKRDILEYKKALADSLGVSRIWLIIVGDMSTAFAALGLGLISNYLLISIERPLNMLSDQITGGLSSQPVNAAVVRPVVGNNFTPASFATNRFIFS